MSCLWQAGWTRCLWRSLPTKPFYNLFHWSPFEADRGSYLFLPCSRGACGYGDLPPHAHGRLDIGPWQQTKHFFLQFLPCLSHRPCTEVWRLPFRENIWTSSVLPRGWVGWALAALLPVVGMEIIWAEEKFKGSSWTWTEVGDGCACEWVWCACDGCACEPKVFCGRDRVEKVPFPGETGGRFIWSWCGYCGQRVLPLQKSSCNGNCCFSEALPLPPSDLEMFWNFRCSWVLDSWNPAMWAWFD